MCWQRGCSWSYPKIGHVRDEPIASMPWRRRLCEHSCLPSRHHPNEESWKDSRLIKTKYEEWFKLINTQSVEDVPSEIKWSHGMVSIVHYALCTNPCSLWESFVGLGLFPWVCIKRKISHNPWRMTSSGDRHQDCGVQVQVEHHEEITAWSLPSIVVTMDLWRCAQEWLTHSGVWGSNSLVFIESAKSRKVVQLEKIKIIII